MIRSICGTWYNCARFARAAVAGIAIASSFLIGDSAVAQHAQPKPNTNRFNFTPAKPPVPAQKRAQQKKAPTKAAPRARLKVPKPETLLALIRLNLVGLDQALKADDFRVLHAISAPALKSRMTADQLAAAFAGLKAQRPDLASVVIVTPQITESPAMLKGNILNVVGSFPTHAHKIDFHLQFQPANRQWRIRGLKVTAEPRKAKATAPAGKPVRKKRRKKPAAKKP